MFIKKKKDDIMIFIACVGQTRYKSMCGGVLPQAVGLRGSGEYCSVDYVLYLVPAIYSPCESEPQAQVFFSNASNVSINNCTGADECRQPAPCTLFFYRAAGLPRFQLRKLAHPSC